MANEAILRDRIEDPINFICANAAAIEKGAVVKLADARVVSNSTGSGDVVGGIAAREKITLDGRTSIPIFRRGIFDMLASGGITVGQAVATASSTGANTVRAAVATDTGAKILGTALETASDGEVIQIELNIGANNNAYS